MTRDAAADIRRIAAERILVLDGAWGVLLQNRGLTEADFRGARFASHSHDLLNNPDLLNLTQPDVVRSGVLAGAVHHMVKPFSLDALLGSVQSLLRVHPTPVDPNTGSDLDRSFQW